MRVIFLLFFAIARLFSMESVDGISSEGQIDERYDVSDAAQLVLIEEGEYLGIGWHIEQIKGNEYDQPDERLTNLYSMMFCAQMIQLAEDVDDLEDMLTELKNNGLEFEVEKEYLRQYYEVRVHGGALANDLQDPDRQNNTIDDYWEEGNWLDADALDQDQLTQDRILREKLTISFSDAAYIEITTEGVKSEATKGEISEKEKQRYHASESGEEIAEIMLFYSLSDGSSETNNISYCLKLETKVKW